MERTSGITPAAVLKLFGRVAKHPWIASRLAILQGEKWALNLWGPVAREGRARHIRQVSFRLTDRCNLRCHTCGQWGDHGYLHGRDLQGLRMEEVPFHRYRFVLEDLVRHGHSPLVYLWGGEPMLYRHCIDLVEAATSLHLPVSIATNGTRVAPVADRLVKAPLFLLQVSIDGHCSTLHNEIRPGVGGGDNFSDLVQALESIAKQRRQHRSTLPLVASLTVISRRNAQHLADIYETFRSHVDLFVFYLSWWIDEERADAHERDFLLRFGFLPTKPRGWVGTWKPDDYSALHHTLEDLMQRARDWNAPPVILVPSITGEDDLRRYYADHGACFGFQKCVSIHQVVEVNSNGAVSPCRDYHDYVVGNIKHETLTQLWNNPSYRLFRKSLSVGGLMPACSRCCGLMGY